MEESKEQQSMHRFLQFCIYLSVALELALFVFSDQLSSFSKLHGLSLDGFFIRMARIPFYSHLIYSKLFTLLLICLVCVGTLSKKKKDLNPKNAIAYPLALGLLVFFGGCWCQGKQAKILWMGLNGFDLGFVFCSIAGTLLIHVAMDNVSKMISSSLGKDKWNVEGESFMQPTKSKLGQYIVNIPMLFYYKGKVRKGYIVLENIFRGTLLCGVPGSGKSFGIVNSFIRDLMGKGFALCIFDLKFPDLGKIAYYHYLLAKQQGRCLDHEFHVVNLDEVEKSRRVNPLKRSYILTLADACETSEALVEALKKGDKSSGSDQFFTQSAINFLSACVYFFSRYKGGIYSSFPHVLAFLNLSYEEIFTVLFTEPELISLLSPFMTAYKAKAYEQLEGQVGTLKIFISRLATKETFWVFSGDDFQLKISDPKSPGVLILASNPSTQGINSTCYSMILNRLTRLINSKGNLPSGLIIDECPTLFVYKVQDLIAQARSNLTAVLLGLQELPQLQQQYGKESAAVITSVVGNVISGAVRSKETMDWLERLFGKVKQQGEGLSIDRNKVSMSLNEKLEPLIPAGKIASLKAGELVGILAADAVQDYTGKFQTSAINCRVNLDMGALRIEEQNYKELPVYYDFGGNKEEILRKNFAKINEQIRMLALGFVKTGAKIQQDKPGKSKSSSGGLKV